MNYYSDFDQDSACWGVFDDEEGKCHALYSSPEEAKVAADKKNQETTK